MATLKEVEQASLEYFGGNALAASVFATKYPLSTPDGNILELTPDDMHRRLAREFARVEAKYKNPLTEDEIYSYLEGFKYIIPQGSPMSGIGNDHQMQSVSNCFVIEKPWDSYGGILKADQEMVQICKRRGGVGTDLSPLRPKGLPTLNAAKSTDGIEVFMARYSSSIREVAQNGRRGALMMTLSVHHPQIMDFIKIKRNRDQITGANISIQLTDEFMIAVRDGTDYELRFPVNADQPIMSEMVDARETWKEIIESAWGFAEPGLLFWDTVLRFSPADVYSHLGFKTISTNPCGELPLPSDDSCRLQVLNLLSFVVHPFTADAYFDLEKFREVVTVAQRLMDDLIDLEIEKIDQILVKIASDPEPDHVKAVERDLWLRIKQKAKLGRRTGLGITALGDMLAALNIQYGSEEAIEMTEDVYKHLAIYAYASSVTMAKERGAFPIHDHQSEVNHPYLERLWEAWPQLRVDMMKYGRRNIALLTTAPAGSVSIEAKSLQRFSTTSGIEPAIYIQYTRRKRVIPGGQVTVDYVDPNGDTWTEFQVYHSGYLNWAEITGHDLADVEKSPYHQATIDDIDPIAKIRMQSAAQRWVDHAISNTVNLPESATREQVAEIYMQGWEMGCKGVTVYREGSRSGVIVKASKNEESEKQHAAHSAPKRPKELPCDIHQVTIKGQKWTILIGLMDDRPYEVMGGLSSRVEIPRSIKTGTLVKRLRKTMPSIYDLIVGDGSNKFKIKDVVAEFDNPDYSAHTRLLSLSLRHGAEVNYVIEQLEKGDKDADLFGFTRVLARTLKRYINDGARPGGDADCPHCGTEDSLRYTEGCVVCPACRWSKCG